jgi:hypothetical protein
MIGQTSHLNSFNTIGTPSNIYLKTMHVQLCTSNAFFTLEWTVNDDHIYISLAKMQIHAMSIWECPS